MSEPSEWLRFHEAYGEWAYSMMYDASSFPAAAAHYSDVKDAFAEAIRLAREEGRPDDVMRLEKRLDDIQAVYRSQFS